MQISFPFKPHDATTTVTPNNTSVSTTLGGGPQQVRIASLAANPIAYIKIGTGTVTASATDMPILPGSTIVITKGSNDKVAVFSATAATLYLTPGEGS